MTRFAGLALAALAVLLAGSGCASRDPDSYDPALKYFPKFKHFEAADTDHSGKLSPQEAQAIPLVARYFREMDTDRSGDVSWQEVTHLDLRAVRRNEIVPPGP
ncbi:MAG TPA: EF-hand domain-containing protein [Nevskiaceae bacterium]|nr:EF-hand domain-containing protein [Nevskiaceae bacterium]